MPLPIEHLLREAQNYTKAGQLLEAEKVYQQILSDFPEDKKVIQEYHKLKTYIEAENSSISKLPQEEIQELITLCNKGQNHPGQLAIALVKAEMLTQKFPSAFITWNVLGIANQGLGNLDEASKAFRKVTELNPNSDEGFIKFAATLEIQGKLDEALGAFKKASELNPNSLYLHKKILSLIIQTEAFLVFPNFSKFSLEYLQSKKKENIEKEVLVNFAETEASFFVLIVSEALQALDENTFDDNFDTERFNYDGNDHSKKWYHQEYVFFFNWLIENNSDLFQAFLSLEDLESKELFLNLLIYRIGSHFSVKLPLKFLEGDSENDYLQLENHSLSSFSLSGFVGNIRHYKFIFKNHQYCVDCLGLKFYLHRKQYFLNRDVVSVQPEAGDYVVDGGACLGDTAAVFSNAVGELGMVYSFDPLMDHIEILEHNTAQFPIKNVKVMPFGLGNENIDSEPVRLNSYNPGFSAGSSVVPLRKIDTLVRNHEIKRINFIKLDVEGFEMQVLIGGFNAINRFKPKIAVSLYHKPNDMFEILTYIKEYHPFYKFYLGHYTIHKEETVLYCDPIDL